MDLIRQMFAGIPWDPWILLLLFALQTITLLFCTIVTSRGVGGIDFGPAHRVMAKGAVLLLGVTLLNAMPLGILLSGLWWYFGLMYCYRLNFRETGMLTRMNWTMNWIWKLLILVWWM